MNEVGTGETRTAPSSPTPPRAGAPLGLLVLAGAVAGVVLGAVIGYSLGMLMLSWFGGPYCCGLEGLLAPALGTLIGGATGLLLGIALPIERRRSPRPLRLWLLVMLSLLGLGTAWLLDRLTAFTFDIEDVASMVLFHSLAIVIPVGIWWFFGRGPRSRSS